MPKDRLSNEHSPQTQRERSEIAYRPTEYANYNGYFDTIKVGNKTFPFTVRGQRKALAYADETNQGAFAHRRCGKDKRRS